MSFQKLFILICLVGGLSQAQQTKPEKIKMPAYKLAIPSPYYAIVDFADGRQAQVLSEEFSTEPLSVALDMTESTCPGFRPEKKRCEFQIPSKLQIFSFVWTAYPENPNKIGHPVQIKAYKYNPSPDKPDEFQESENLILGLDFADENVTYFQKKPTDSEKWILACEDKNLFSPVAKSRDLFKVLSLSSEINGNNSETDTNENQGFQSLENMNFKPHEKGYQLQSIGNGTKGFSILFGQNQHWVVSNPKNEICELSFSSDLSKLGMVLREYSDKPLNYKKAVPTAWASAMAYDLVNLKDELTRRLMGEGVLE